MVPVLADVPRMSFALDPLIAEAKRRARQRRFLVSAVLAAVVATAAGLTFAVSSSPGGPGSPSGRPGPGSGASGGSTSGSPTTSSAAFLRGRLVRQFAAVQDIQGLRVLVSAGSGTNSSAVIVGTDLSGEECWTVVAALGEAGGGFRCGTSPGVEQGEPAALRTFRVGCQTSGRAGAGSADAASCIGFVGPSVAKVEAKLVDGSTSALPVTEGAFAYAGPTRDALPVSFSAYSAGGQEVGRQDIVLASGLGTNGG